MVKAGAAMKHNKSINYAPAAPDAAKLRRLLRRYAQGENLRVIIFTLLSLVCVNSWALDISNFKSGLACTDGKSFGWVCHTTEDVYITGQGQCNRSGQNKPCTWYGFQFDYINNDDKKPLNCKYEISQKVALGNPMEVANEGRETGSFSFSLKGSEGHFFNPQYYILTTKPEKDSLLSMTTTCSVENKEVFKYKINAHFPT